MRSNASLFAVIAVSAVALPAVALADEEPRAAAEVSTAAVDQDYSPDRPQLILSADYGYILGGVEVGIRYQHLELEVGKRFAWTADDTYVGAKAFLAPHEIWTPYVYGRVGTFRDEGWNIVGPHSPPQAGTVVTAGLGFEVHFGQHVYGLLQGGMRREYGRTDEDKGIPVDLGLGLGLRF